LQEPVAATKYSDASAPRHTSLLELARLFLKLGIVAFGGPPAHIALMEDEVVSRRGWLTREEFLDFLGVTNLIPGPNSTEMAIHVGRVRAGWPGLLVAGASFILPSAVMVTALAWAYVRFGSLPQVAGLLYGVKPIVIALIVQAVFKLAKTAVKSTWIGGVGVCAALATALGVDQLAVLAGGGLLTGLACWLRSGRRTSTSVKALFMSGSGFTVFAAPSGAGASFNLTALFLVFLKIGAILFGGGLRAGGADSFQPGGRTGLDQRTAITRCHRHGTGNSGPSVHNRNLYWLSVGRPSWGGDCDRRDFSPGILLCGN
jgi:chromate transporter